MRNSGKKLIECEERLTFWKNMVKLGIGVREVEHMCEEINMYGTFKSLSSLSSEVLGLLWPKGLKISKS